MNLFFSFLELYVSIKQLVFCLHTILLHTRCSDLRTWRKRVRLETQVFKHKSQNFDKPNKYNGCH